MQKILGRSNPGQIPKKQTMNEPQTKDSIIYHIAAEQEFKSCIADGNYGPPSLAADGFIHCTSGRSVLLAVAEDYYSDVDDALLVLKIDLSRIQSEVRFEDPSPLPGGGKSHEKLAQRFPHIYGLLNLSAVTGIGTLSRQEGEFVWPDEFVSLNLSDY